MRSPLKLVSRGQSNRGDGAESSAESYHSPIPPGAIEVHVALFMNGPTKSVEAQTALLEAVASEPESAPTHGGIDERKRLPFSAKALATQAGTNGGASLLWRLEPPKYWGSVDSSKLPISRILLHYEDLEPRSVGPVCGGISRLVDKLEPAYAALHFKWGDATSEQAASMRGFSAKALHYCKFGPPGVFAWTWFGPTLVERLGMATLLAQGATSTSWGGAALPLVAQPWSATFEALRERQIAVDNVLRPMGIFGDYSEPVPQMGAQWAPLAGPSKAEPGSPTTAPQIISTSKIPAEWVTARGTGRFVRGGNVEGRDLRGVDLSGIRLEEVVADRADLREANLQDFRCLGGSFVETCFYGAILASARFHDVLLSGARFNGAQLQTASLSTCSLREASLVSADLLRANLVGADLTGADLTDAVMKEVKAKGAIFRGACLLRANFSAADLSGALFSGADLTDAVWEGANLSGARFDPGMDPRGI
jgi:uncharacterized protein YjbI with pentapeptide repeats